jgi:hypothetical protein
MSSGKPVKLIVVHGTFSNHFRVHSHSAKLIAFIEKIITPKRVAETHYFDWSEKGKACVIPHGEARECTGSAADCVVHRRECSEHLAKYIHEKAKDFDIVLFTHSHGTTVALHSFEILYKSYGFTVQDSVHLLVSLFAPRYVPAVLPLLATPSMRPAQWLNIYKYGDSIAWIGSTSAERLVPSGFSFIQGGWDKFTASVEASLLKSTASIDFKSLADHYLFEPAVNFMVATATVDPSHHFIDVFFNEDYEKIKDRDDIFTCVRAALDATNRSTKILSEKEFIALPQTHSSDDFKYVPEMQSLVCKAHEAEFKNARVLAGAFNISPIFGFVQWLWGSSSSSSSASSS